VARTGAVFYAETARSASEHEVHLIGVASLCGIALLMMWVFRSPRLLLLGFVSTALGIVCALAVTMLVFGKLHLLTLVFGASLIGEAVDYSIQYFVVYLGAQRDWDARRGARAVRPALTVALTTSLLGYAILTWVPFPALKQIACFAIAGIATAFASVLWLLPALLTRAPKRSPQRVFAGAARMLTLWHGAIGGKRAWFVAALLLLLAIPGWLRLTSDDDIHLLIQRDPVLVAQEDKVREAVGVDNSAQFFVVRGETPEVVLQRAEALGTELDALNGTANKVGSYQSVAQFVPSAKQQNGDRALLAQHVFNDPAALRATLLQAGFKDEVADAWLAAYAKPQPPLTVETWLAAPWSQPYKHLWLGEVDPSTKAYAAVVIPQGVTPQNEPALIATAQGLPGVVFVDKAASVSKLFGAYRLESGWWLGGALALVLVLLMVRYGVRGGIAVALPVLLAVGVTLAVFGYAHVPLNLFNWLALMLVLGVGANYAVFLREGCLRANADLGAVWTGVLLSAATTLLSFGMLGMSAMPALKSFGATLALGIAVSVLLAPIGMPSESRRAA
jgi:predicted exporter